MFFAKALIAQSGGGFDNKDSYHQGRISVALVANNNPM